MTADTAYFEPGMLVSLAGKRVARVKSTYRYENRLVPAANHRRYWIELEPGNNVDVSEHVILGRVSYGRAPLSVVSA